MKSPKKILLLTAGGTLTTDKKGSLFYVNSVSDVDAWLHNFPELSILADIEVKVVMPEDSAIDPKVWEKIAKTIRDNKSKFDSFIVVSKPEQLIYCSLAVSYLLQNFKKTIVFTGSYLSGTSYLDNSDLIKKFIKQYGGLGLRSNLINSLHVTESSLPSPAIMFGSRLLPSYLAKYDHDHVDDPFLSVTGKYWGKLDFGVNVNKNLSFNKKAENVYEKIDNNVLVIENLPSVFWPEISGKENYKVAIIRFTGGYELEESKIIQIEKWPWPVVLFNYKGDQKISNAIKVNEGTWANIIVKSMWASANTGNQKEFGAAIKKDLIGEYSLVS